MKRRGLKIYSVLLVLLGIYLIGFLSFSNTAEAKRIQDIKQWYLSGLEDFSNSLEDYSEAAQSLQSSEVSINKLQAAHTASRNAFKKVEFLFSHIDPQIAKDFLNATYYTKLDPNDQKRKEKIALGQLLFFDPVLSANNQRSCASCHNPKLGFTDGLNKSMALNFEGKIQRNSPILINSIYAERYFYDMRLELLKGQMEHVVFNEEEFNSDFEQITERIAQSSEYIELFESAFPGVNKPIAKWTIEMAITEYVASITAFNSPFDQYVRGEIDQIDESVKRGFNLFMGKGACGTCHFAPIFNGNVPPLFQDTDSEVLGVPATKDTINPEIDPDLGRIANGMIKEEAPFYKYSFKTTTRNVALTAPYMHNGVYDSLEEVVNFYNIGSGLGLGLDVPTQTLPGDQLNLTKDEVADIVSFMEALTDTKGITSVPERLPSIDKNEELNNRVVGGVY